VQPKCLLDSRQRCLLLCLCLALAPPLHVHVQAELESNPCWAPPGIGVLGVSR
jgi:hypothetical protein